MADARFQGGLLLDSEALFVVASLPLVFLRHTGKSASATKTGVAEVAYSVEWQIRGLFVFNKMAAIPFVRVCRVKSSGDGSKITRNFAGFLVPWDRFVVSRSPPIRRRRSLHDAILQLSR